MPFVAQWPRVILAGTLCEQPASQMDLLPTLTKLAGGEVPQDRIIDGRDIWHLFSTKAAAPTKPSTAADSLNAIRVGKWKLHVARGFRGEDRREMPQLLTSVSIPEKAIT